MSLKSTLLLTGLAICGLTFSATANAGLLGKTLTISYYNNTSIVSTTATLVTVSSSQEVTAWPTVSFPSPQFPKININISDTAITISNDQEVEKSWRMGGAPLYLVFSDTTDSIPDFSSDPTKTYISDFIAGITASDLTVTANSISILLNDATLPTKSSLDVLALQIGFADNNPNPSPIPAPSSILLLAAGLLLRNFKKKSHNC